jgi:hypothetical protein
MRPDQDPLSWSFRTDRRFRVRHVERVASSRIAERLQTLLADEPMPGGTVVVADAARSWDLLTDSELSFRLLVVPVTGAMEEKSEAGSGSVSRAELMRGLELALRSRKLHGKSVTRALSEHDMALALALAWWRASQDL